MASEPTVTDEMVEVALKAWLKATSGSTLKNAFRAALTVQSRTHVVVPREPTREMWAAMANTLYGYKNRHHDKVVSDLWTAMLAATEAPDA